MKSIRLDPALEARLERAAATTGESLSKFIRRAAVQRADSVLDADVPAEFADVIGVVRAGGRRARRSGAVFAELLGDRGR